MFLSIKMSRRSCLLLFVSTAALGYASSEVDSLSKCFKRTSRRAIDNHMPIAEYHMVSLRACTDYCIMAAGNVKRKGPLCRSFTYEIAPRTCRLYNHDGMKVPAILHPAIGIDFYKRVSDEDQCKTPEAGSTLRSRPISRVEVEFKWMTETQSERYTFDNNLNFATFGTISAEDENFHDYARLPVGVENTEAESEQLQRKDIPNGVGDLIEDEMKLLHKKSSSNISTVDEEQAMPQEPCSTSTAYYVVIGNEIVRPINNGGSVKVFNNVDQGDCAKYCSLNQGPHKEELVCFSLNYFPTNRKCELYSILAEPHGPGSLVENQDSIYAEKFCLPESGQTCQADEVFILHVQRSLSGIPIAQTRTQSISTCLQSCLKKYSCKTGVFDSMKQQCQLYAESVSDSRDAVVETPPGFVMIENGCAESRGAANKQGGSRSQAISSNDDSSSEWSDCNFRINGQRVKGEDKDEVEDEQDTRHQQWPFRFGDVEMPKGEMPVAILESISTLTVWDYVYWITSHLKVPVRLGGASVRTAENGRFETKAC